MLIGPNHRGKAERRKLSALAEECFRRLAERIGQPMLRRKGERHRLVQTVEPSSISREVWETLDPVESPVRLARPSEPVTTG